MGHQNVNMGMHHQGREAEAKHKIRVEGAAMSGTYVQVRRSATAAEMVKKGEVREVDECGRASPVQSGLYTRHRH